MKRQLEEMSFPDIDDTDGTVQCPVSPKRATANTTVLKLWVESLPPESGCVSASFEVGADGIVNDLKAAITARLSHPRFCLYKRHFKLTQGGQHRQFYEKLSVLRSDTPVKFEWADYPSYSQSSRLEYRP